MKSEPRNWSEINQTPVSYAEKDIHEAFIHALIVYSFYYIRYQHLVKIDLH